MCLRVFKDQTKLVNFWSDQEKRNMRECQNIIAAELVHIHSSIESSIAFQEDIITVSTKGLSNSQVDGRLQIYYDNTYIHNACINNGIERHRTQAISQPVQAVEWSWSADLQVVATIWMGQQVHSRMKDLGHVSAERRWQQGRECDSNWHSHKTQYYVHIKNYWILGWLIMGLTFFSFEI